MQDYQDLIDKAIEVLAELIEQLKRDLTRSMVAIAATVTPMFEPASLSTPCQDITQAQIDALDVAGMDTLAQELKTEAERLQDPG